MKNLLKFFLIACFALFFISCSVSNGDAGFPYGLAGPKSSSGESWTVILYMAADNELEGTAISTIKDLEKANIPQKMKVLALVDRCEGYDSSNGNWTDTRLYEIKKDTSINEISICSDRLECPELGLSDGTSVELDMGNRNVLAGILKFARRKYQAEHYALIMWGHGAGWKGYSLDETNASRMSLPALRNGIEEGMDGKKLDFIGFDTCFGANLETALELCNCAEFMSGTPGIEGELGWNYTALFRALGSSSVSGSKFSEAALRQFAEKNEDYEYACFCTINLSQVENLVRELNVLSERAAFAILYGTSYGKNTKYLEVIEKNVTSYLDSGFPSDFYLDVKSLVKNIEKIEAEDAGKNTVCFFDYDFEPLYTLIDAAVPESWSRDGEGCSPGIYFSTYRSEGIFELSHPSAYVYGSRDIEKCRFVSECNRYVPDCNTGRITFLNILFYSVLDMEEVKSIVCY